MRTTRTRRGAAVLLLALTLPLGLSACGTTDRAQTASGARSADTAPSGGDSEDEGASSSSGGASVGASGGASTGAVVKQDAVLASAEGEHDQEPGEDDVRVPLLVEVTALERIDGDAVELRFRISNLGDVTWTPGQSLGSSGFGRFGASEVTLLDLPGDRKYLSLRDSEDNCLCTTYGVSEHEVPAGESNDFYVRFVAPPEDVSSIEVQVPGFAPMPGVEISS